LRRVICDLEGVELEAAAYLYRVLGFKPVRELGHAVMGQYDLPNEVSFKCAINGMYPLTYYVMDSTGKPRASAVEAVVESVSEGEVVGGDQQSESESVSETRGQAEPFPKSSPKLKVRFDFESTDESDGGDSLAEVDGDERDIEDKLWAAVAGLALGREVEDVGEGKLVAVRGVGPGIGEHSVFFPRGLDSVVETMSCDGVLPSSLETYDRRVAIRLVMDRYNVCALEVLAASGALKADAARIVRACKDPEVAAYFKKVVEVVGRYDLEQTSLRKLLLRLVTPSMFLEELRDVDSLLARREGEYAKEFTEAMRVVGYDGEHVALRLSESLRGVPLGVKPRIHGRIDGVRKFEVGPGDRAVDRYSDSSGRHRRHSSRSSSGSTSSSGSVLCRPPRWMGLKSVTYHSDEKGKLKASEVRVGKVLRTLGFEDKVLFED